MEAHGHTREGSLTGSTVGHFRILDLVGTGGMGEVYRARDTRLKRTVAVKAPTERMATDSSARQRFIRETRLAAQVTHAHVATVLDVVESDERLLLVMEYIDGQPLSGRMREARLEPEQAIRLGREVAEGLSAIHKAGLVHRDLKPANVMITGDGHAKVTDFGLARQNVFPMDATTLASTDTHLTEPGRAVGTLIYMSPEQLRGESIDGRSDLFSLGTVLYEMLCSKHPFVRTTLAETVEAIREGAPGGPGPEPEVLAANPALGAVVHKLLEKDPARRYQSAEELLADMRRIDARQLSRRRSFVRRVAMPAALVFLFGAASGGAWWASRPLAWEAPRVSVAFVPFQDRTGDDSPFRGLMAADLLASDLQSSHLVRALGPDETAPLIRGLPGDADPGAVVSRVVAGVSTDYVALGKLYHEGGYYVASIELLPARAGMPALQPLRLRAKTISKLADRASWDLRRSLPAVSTLTAWRDGGPRVEEITSASEEARLLYERGIAAQRDGKLNEAIDWLERAVEADPGFALAYGRLATALREARYDRRAREAASKAVRLAPDPDARATRRLAWTLEAIRARVFDRNEEAVEATERLVRLYPDEPGFHEMHGLALDRTGAWADALAQLDRGLALDPARASIHVARAGVLLRLGRGEEGLAALDRAEALYRTVDGQEGLAEVDTARGRILIHLERFPEAEAVLARAQERYRSAGNEGQVARVLLEAAKSDVARGNAAAADDKLNQAIAIARELGIERHVYDAKTLAGAQHYRQGRFDSAERLLREAVDLGRQLENDFVIYPQFNLGSLLNYLGRLDEAREETADCLATARKLGRKDMVAHAQRTLADIDYQRGDLEAAVLTYEQLLADSEPDGATRSRAKVHSRLAEIHERRGRLGTALASVDRAVAMDEELDTPGDLGYALYRRARILAGLGRDEAAVSDLARAREIGESAEARLGDLLIKCDLGEAGLAGYAGDWARARNLAGRAAAATAAGPPVDLALARSLECRAAMGLDDDRPGAVERCRAAAEVARAPAAERTGARALLAEALWRAGRLPEAAETAAAAIAAAERMGLLLPAARAAAVLRLARDDTPASRASGRRALDAYLQDMAPADRARVAQRAEIRWLESVLATGVVPEVEVEG